MCTTANIGYLSVFCCNPFNAIPKNMTIEEVNQLFKHFQATWAHALKDACDWVLACM